MELAHRWADRNLTRLELVCACLILALLIGFALRHMLIFFARTEKIMVNTSIVNIDTALKYHAAIAIMRGDREFLSGLMVRSPFSVVNSSPVLQSNASGGIAGLNTRIIPINTMPANYLGELDNPDHATLEAGSWYFDTVDRSLNYLVRNDEYFYSDLEGVPRIKLRVNIAYNDRDGDARFDPEVDEYKTVSLRSIGNFSWAE
jgi:hypothetical protein